MGDSSFEGFAVSQRVLDSQNPGIHNSIQEAQAMIPSTTTTTPVPDPVPAPSPFEQPCTTVTNLSPQQYAHAYLDLGLSLVPEVYGTTRPVHSGWQTLTIDRSNFAQYFPSGSNWNIGVINGADGNGIHDVDLDCPESANLAPHFLPQTNWVFGRASNPASHWVYKVTGGSTPRKELKGPDGRGLVELRGDGSKTTFPPSYKTDVAEMVRWETMNLEAGPSEVPLDRLKRSVSLLAIASILLRQYPPTGNRHESTLALVGSLLKSGLTEEEITHLVLTVAQLAGDPSLDDRRVEVQTTIEAFKQDRPVTGWHALAEKLGESGFSIIKSIRQAIAYGVPTPEEPKLPLQALPDPIKRIVEGISDSLGADPALCLLPLLAAMGSAIGTTRAVRVNSEWQVFPFLWACLVTEAGGFKTPSRKPITDLLAHRERQKLNEYYLAYEAYEEDEERYRRSRNQEEGQRPEKPVKPSAPCVYATDITLEAITAKLAGNPRGFILWSEELNDIFTIPTRYSSGGSDISRLNNLYDGTPLRVSRKTGEIRERDFHLSRGFVSIAGGIQPNVLISKVKDHFLDSGFLQRFILVQVESKLCLYQDRNFPSCTKRELQFIFDALFDLRHMDGENTPLTYVLNPEALELFISWNNFLENLRHAEKDPHKKTALSKQRDLALRIAVIFHTVQIVQNRLSPNTEIDACTMFRAITLTQWLIWNWAKVYDFLRAGGSSDTIEKLTNLIWAKSNGTGIVTVRELMRWNNRLYPNADAAANALQGLLELGLARSLSDSPLVFDRAKSIQLLRDIQGLEDSVPKSHPVYRFQPPGHLGLTIDCIPPLTWLDGPPESPGPIQPSESNAGSTDPHELNTCTHTADLASVVNATSFSSTNFSLVSNAHDLDEAVSYLEESRQLAVDLETTGLNPKNDRIRLLTVTAQKNDGSTRTFVFDFFMGLDHGRLLNALGGKALYLHNASFDLGFLRNIGFQHAGPIHDTMIMARLLHAGTDEPSTLQACSKRYLDLDLPKDEQRADWSGPLSESQLNYAANDTAHLFQLADRLLSDLEQFDLMEAYNLEMGCLPQVVEMGYHGVPVDTNVWQLLHEENLNAFQNLTQELNQITMNGDQPWNWNSPKQVIQAFKSQGIALTKTNDDTLAKVDHPLATTLRRYRKVQKLLSAYGNDWLEKLCQGRVHPTWKQLEARTGRMACKEPNIQQLPKDRYRAAIAPGEGKVLIKADYSQIELRVLAEVTQDPKLLEAYQQGRDLHEQTAREVLQIQEVTRNDRQLAKALNFGLAFGMGAKTFAEYAKSGYGVELTEAEAREHRAKFLRTYQEVKRWQDRITSATGKLAPETRTLSGRRRLVEQGTGYSERLNTPIQGTAADGLKAALGILWQRRDEMAEAKVIIACHDEIVVEATSEQAEQVKQWLVTAMVEGMSRYVCSVPVVVEATIGASWQQ